ncbi:MAG: hypothetical protein RMK19_06040 [Bacteroidia bacterium]|nr:hypothetical protein [Bacteroidia bacterium]MDW8015553.1 hypothetical protein [Bacteroidia bacterium]
MRWASLAPEATLWIEAGGRLNALVGRSHLCVEPPKIWRLPVCTRPNVVRSGWESYLGPYAPDYGALSTLRPTGVLLLIEEMPADISLEELFKLFREAIGFPVEVFPLYAPTWDSYEKLIGNLGSVLKSSRLLQRWFDAQRRRLDRLTWLVSRLTHKPTVAFLEPTEPISVIRGWTETLAQWSGGDLSLGKEGRILWERLLTSDPEVIILSLPGSTLSRAGEALAQWVRLPPVQGLRAFRQKRLYAFKGTAGLFYPSPLLISAAEGVYELLHTPTYRYNRHQGRLWAPLL